MACGVPVCGWEGLGVNQSKQVVRSIIIIIFFPHTTFHSHPTTFHLLPLSPPPQALERAPAWPRPPGRAFQQAFSRQGECRLAAASSSPNS